MTLSLTADAIVLLLALSVPDQIIRTQTWGANTVDAGLETVVLAPNQQLARSPTMTTPPHGQTFDREPVTVVVAGSPLYIPKAYIFHVSSESVAIEALLPDLAPISPTNAYCLANQRSCPDVLWLQVNTLSYGDRSTIYGGILRGDGVSGPYGLQQFEWGGSYFYVGAIDGEFFHLSCSKEDDSYSRCTYRGNFAPPFGASYGYRKSHLSRWREIHDEVKKLVKSFMVRP